MKSKGKQKMATTSRKQCVADFARKYQINIHPLGELEASISCVIMGLTY